MLDIVRQPRPGLWSGPSWLEEPPGWQPFAGLEALFTREVSLPVLEVREAADAYLFELDVPGMTEDDLEVTITDRRLAIAGRRVREASREDGRSHLRERRSQHFHRSFELPADADPETLSADLRHGILRVRCGKRGAPAGRSWFGRLAQRLKGWRHGASVTS